MKAKGSTISSSTTPDSSTTMLNSRPRSLWKVMSPKPRVLMTVSAQYTPVIHECSWPSTWSMITWKPMAKSTTVTTNRSE